MESNKITAVHFLEFSDPADQPILHQSIDLVYCARRIWDLHKIIFKYKIHYSISYLGPSESLPLYPIGLWLLHQQDHRPKRRGELEYLSA